MARPFAAPPGIPGRPQGGADRGLRPHRARIAEFLAEAQRLNFDVNPVAAARLDALLAEAYATPKDVIARAAKALSD